MKPVLSTLPFLLVAVAALAAAAPAAIFPAAAPGMTFDAVKAAFPAIKESTGAPAGAKGYTLPDTALALGARLLFIDGKLAMLTYQVKPGKLPEVFKAAKEAYGERKEGDGENAGLWTHENASLQITGDPDDGVGSVTFFDAEAMKKLPAAI